MKAIVAIDPGLSGSWGAIDHNGKYLGCGDMHNEGKIIQTNKVWDEIKAATAGYDIEFCIEQVSARPGQGTVSMFTFGGAYMAAIAIAQRSYRPTTMVTPQKWKKAMGLSKDKNLSLDMARGLWPQAPLKRKKDNGRAEALLIAEFFRREMYD
jgi:crossover junction endodeoxyribonuclease RuvC